MRLWQRFWYVVVALAVFQALWLWRGFPWTLALLAAVAIGALARASWKTFERLRELYRPPEPTISKTDPP